MTDKLPVDHAARERFCREWRHNFAVSANAGSGKTTAISERLATMALDPEGAEALRHTAVVTYTVKAAAEIAERARERLLQKLSADGGATGPGLAALEHLERAFFGTLHSFCIKLAREHGLESGLELAPEVLATEPDIDAIWEDFLAEDPMEFSVLDEQRRSALFRFVEMEAVFDRARQLPVATAKALVRRAPVGPQPNPAWGEWEVLQSLAAKGAGKANMVASQTKARIWRERYESDGEASYLGIYEPDGKAAELLRVSRLWMKPLLEWASPAAGALAGELALRFQQFRKNRGVQTYEDQVEAARDLLEKPKTLETVRREGWRVILDEAQDTDEAQFFVLVEITRPSGAKVGSWPGCGAPPKAGHFCMVGDGQQAIYSSRASVRTFQRYLSAFDGGAAGDSLNFEVTFRAPHAVVNLLNQSLPKAFGPDQEHNMGLPVDSGVEPKCLQVPYQPLRAGPGNATGEVRRIEIKSSAGKKSGKKDAEAFREEMNEIAEWLHVQGPAGVGVERWGDLCILLPRNGWMNDAAKALQDAGFKVARQSKRTKAGMQPTHAWMTGLLSVCCYPEDDYEWFGILREIFGISDAILASEKRRLGRFDWEAPERHVEPVRQALLCLRASILTAGDENMMLDVWARELIKACNLEQRAKALDAIGSCYQELLRIEGDVRKLASEGGAPRDWLQYLRRSGQTHGSADKPDSDAINLMTCHSAKGLEWPAVLVPGLWRKASFAAESGIQVFPDEHGGQVVYLKSGYIPAETKESRQRERRRELVRLLYVTLTRARKTLLLSWSEADVADPAQSFFSIWGLDLAEHQFVGIGEAATRNGPDSERLGKGRSIGPQVAPPEADESGAYNLECAEKNQSKHFYYRRLLPHQMGHSSDMPRVAISEDATEPSLKSVESIDPIDYGLWWHETMEFLPWNESSLAVADYGSARLRAAATIAAERRGLEEWQKLTNGPDWQLLAHKRWKRLAEMSVLAPIDFEGGWIDGVIDLVLLDSNQREVWIIDWKTNRRNSDEIKAVFFSRLKNEYTPQLKAYKTSLMKIFSQFKIKAFLFSTVFGEMIEVTEK